MTLYDDHFDSHPVWASTGVVREALEEVADKLADPQQISIHARIEAVVNLVASRRDVLDAQLVQFGVLDSIDQNVQNLVNALHQFRDNPGNRDVLNAADTFATGILSYLVQLPPPTATDVESLHEIGARYRASMSGHMSRITTEANELHDRLEQLRAQVETQEGQVGAEVTRLSEVATTASSGFETAQAEREGRFDAKLAEFDARVTAALEEPAATARSEGEAALADLKQKADTAWEDVAALKERAENASRYLGINALASGYNETAGKEERQAFWLRIGVILSLVLAVGASAFAVVYHIAEPFSLEGVLTKAIVAVPLLVLAGYCARESSRHSDRAHFNRQRQRQLESLPAYSDGLDSTERAALYGTLAPGFFAPVVGATDKDGAGGDLTGPLLTLLVAELRKRADNTHG